MERTTSDLCLLQHDYLNASNISDGRSSGYESDCSLSPPTSPRAKVKSTSGQSQEMMIYSNVTSLSESLDYITCMPELCDVTFLVGDNQIPLHGVKAILATRSRIFYQVILHHQRISTQNKKQISRLRKWKLKSKTSSTSSSLQIPIPDYDHEVFASLLTFLHSGRVRIQTSTVVGLLCAAIEFELKDLHKACRDFLKRCERHDQKDTLQKSLVKYASKKGAKRIMKYLDDLLRIHLMHLVL